MNSKDAELRSYLAQLDNELTPLAPRDRRDELREARQHLEAMIGEKVAQGVSEVEAVHSAIQNFGSPSDVGRALRLVHLSSHRLLVRFALIIVFSAAIIFAFVTYFGDRSLAPFATWWSRLALVVALETPLIVSWLVVHFRRRVAAQRAMATIRPGGMPPSDVWHFTTFRVVSLIVFSVMFGVNLAMALLEIMEPGHGSLAGSGLGSLASVLFGSSILSMSRRTESVAAND